MTWFYLDTDIFGCISISVCRENWVSSLMKHSQYRGRCMLACFPWIHATTFASTPYYELPGPPWPRTIFFPYPTVLVCPSVCNYFWQKHRSFWFRSIPMEPMTMSLLRSYLNDPSPAAEYDLQHHMSAAGLSLIEPNANYPRLYSDYIRSHCR
jgi:hypothetical protein